MFSYLKVFEGRREQVYNNDVDFESVANMELSRKIKLNFLGDVGSYHQQ